MGPHSFKCGKSIGCRLADAIGKSFNGAALFQVRKVPPPLAPLIIDFPCFNGAALFQVRKVDNELRASGGPKGLQWGRTLSSAERRL